MFVFSIQSQVSPNKLNHSHMSQSDIINRICRIIDLHFSVYNNCNVFTANFTSDLDFSNWEKNLLLYHVEQNFNISLRTGLEHEISNVQQLVHIVSNEVLRRRAS